MINLCLVVIATQFSETKQRENALMREQRARYMSNDSTLASYSEPGSCYEEMLRYISHLYRKFTRRLQRIYSGWHRSETETKANHFRAQNKLKQQEIDIIVQSFSGSLKNNSEIGSSLLMPAPCCH